MLPFPIIELKLLCVVRFLGGESKTKFLADILFCVEILKSVFWCLDF